MPLVFINYHTLCLLFIDCGGLVTTPRIIQPTTETDEKAYSFSHCAWIAKAPENKSVLLRFEELNISQYTSGYVCDNLEFLTENQSFQSPFSFNLIIKRKLFQICP